MNPKDTTPKDKKYLKLIHNNEYYQDVFKKTEKIVSVIFYILNNINIDKKSETHTSNLASKAHFTHENALRTLEVKPAVAQEVLEQFAQSLIGLDSTLRVVSAARVLSPESLTLITSEIRSVLISLRSMLEEEDALQSILFAADSRATAASSPRRIAPAAPKPPAAVGRKSEEVVQDRRTRIMTILEAKSAATIKDISEIVSDISEKTIQRELNTLIEDGVVLRQGERRWSKYVLA